MNIIIIGISVAVFILLTSSIAIFRRIKSKIKEKPEEVTEDQLVNISVPYSFVMEKTKGISIKALKSKFNMSHYEVKMALANFEMMNGDHLTFLVKIDSDRFIFMGNTYVWDNSYRYYVATSKIWAADYHESFALPVKRTIPIKGLRENFKFQDKSIEEINYATNPRTLEDFINSSFIQKSLKGGLIEQFIRRATLLLAIILVETSIMMMILFFKSGALQSLGMK